MATGGCMPAWAAREMTSSASGGPSISTQSGLSWSRAFRRERAEPGPWWRMPKMVGFDGIAMHVRNNPDLRLFAAGSVEVFPAVAFFYYGFEVFLPDDSVLHGVF